MDYNWIQEYCLSKKDAVMEFKVEWDCTRYLIGNKMFALVGGDKEKRPIITLKCEPMFGQLMRQQNENIVAGYYMNKEHWNSVYLDRDVDDNIIKEMIDMSYDLIFSNLPKKLQKEINDK